MRTNKQPWKPRAWKPRAIEIAGVAYIREEDVIKFLKDRGIDIHEVSVTSKKPE